MKKVYLLAIAILLFNCHNAQNTGEMKIQQIPFGETDNLYYSSFNARTLRTLYQ